MKNLSPIDYLCAHAARITEIFQTFLLYKAKFSNYFYILKMRVRKQLPIHAKLKNGTEVLITSNGKFLSILFGFLYDEESNTICLDNGIKLYAAIDNGDPIGIFIRKEYDFLSVKEQTVIDIGANIGDSPLYFASQGAKKIVALEPFPKNYEIALHNVNLNELNGKISLILAGCGSKKGSIMIDDDKIGLYVQAGGSKNGKVIPILTLEDVLDQYGVESAVLKMDCEGCEYDTILYTSANTLRRFTLIQIEYHYGYKNLAMRLKSAGFLVKTTRPHFRTSPNANTPHMYVGMLYASLT
jgi:FkbM family methyltransferase